MPVPDMAYDTQESTICYVPVPDIAYATYCSRRRWLVLAAPGTAYPSSVPHTALITCLSTVSQYRIAQVNTAHRHDSLSQYRTVLPR
eukprot:2121305-Rhodomonas_salina.2